MTPSRRDAAIGIAGGPAAEGLGRVMRDHIVRRAAAGGRKDSATDL